MIFITDGISFLLTAWMYFANYHNNIHLTFMCISYKSYICTVDLKEYSESGLRSISEAPSMTSAISLVGSCQERVEFILVI